MPRLNWLPNHHLQTSPFLFFFFFLSFFFSLSSSSLSNPLNEALFICGTHRYPPGIAYVPNFVAIMEVISQRISANHWGSYVYETNTSTIYTLGQCYDNLSQDDCTLCYAEARTNLPRCVPSDSGRIYLDGCFLRYDNYSFFDEPVNNLLDRTICEQPISSNSSEFAKKVDQVITNVTATAMESGGFGVVSMVDGVNSSVYAMAQCWKSLNNSGCRQCLLKAGRDLRTCAPGRQGGRSMNAGCYFRYSTTKFFDEQDEIESNNGGGSVANMWIIISTVIAGVLLLGLSCYLMWKKGVIKGTRKKKSKKRGMPVFIKEINCRELLPNESSDDPELPSFDLDTLTIATLNFSHVNKLGQGGFGPVYKGVLPDGREIAVKRLSNTSLQGSNEFRNEAKLIARLQHRNLVRLLGCCAEGNETALVYEYMENRSLDCMLFDKTRGSLLDWRTRFNIIGGIARGLLYLHQDSRFRIIHRDLKAGNVLLDGDMKPKISDFGMARIFGGEQTEGNTRRVVGTYGYMSPEYAMDGLFSIKSDVFSFGVLVLEIISGKKNRGFYSNDHDNLLTYAWKLWNEGKSLELMDESIRESCLAAEMLRCMQVGMLCVQERAEDRPTMSSVVLMLSSENAIMPKPKQPGFCVLDVTSNPRNSSGETKSQEPCSVNEVTITLLDPR